MRLADKLRKDLQTRLLTSNIVRRPKTILLTECIGCLRKAYFNIAYNWSPLPNPLMILGRLLHYSLEQIIVDVLDPDEYKIEPTYEIDLGNGWSILAQPDVEAKRRTEKIIVEIKTTKLEKRTMEAIYFAQLSCYVAFLNADLGLLVLFDRENCNVEVLEIKREECNTTLETIKQRAYTIIKYIENQVLPPGPTFEFECKYCPYWSICKHLPRKYGIEQYIGENHENSN